MVLGKAGAGLIVLAALIVPFGLISINYAGTPIQEAAGTIVEIREGVIQSRNLNCLVLIKAEGMGVVTDHYTGECPKNLRVGQRVAFIYRQGRFIRDTLVVARPEGMEKLKILGQTSQ